MRCWSAISRMAFPSKANAALEEMVEVVAALACALKNATVQARQTLLPCRTARKAAFCDKEGADRDEPRDRSAWAIRSRSGAFSAS
jgi:hypothetical protein